MNTYIPAIGERVEKASQFVPQCNRLLDVGCGDGILGHFVSDRVEKLYGVDIDTRELAKAKKNKFTTALVNIDTQKLPFRRDFFNVVTCLDVLEHVKDPAVLLSEICRVLKKDG